MATTARCGVDALVEHAPEVSEHLTSLRRQVPTFGGEPLVALARQVTAAATGLRALPGGADVPLDPTLAELAALEMAGQMAVDVSGVSDAQRAALAETVGRSAHTYLLTAYLADWIPRVDHALDALFGASGPDGGPLTDDRSAVWNDFVALTESIGRLRAVDPVLTEQVRLRMAREHNCALCKSLRNRTALEAGGQESDYAALDSWPTSTQFDDRTRAALALTDILIWTPATLTVGERSELVTQLHSHFSDAELVGLVVGMLRNAANKVAIAGGTDGANVTEGVEIYDVIENGETVFGLDTPF